MPKLVKSPRRKPRGIDRMIHGVGRITIRGTHLAPALRDELDRAIVRAIREGELVALKLLKDRGVSPLQFLDAYRRRQLRALKAREPLQPLVERWLASRDLRVSSRERYSQSWRFLRESLPANATLDDLTDRWWEGFTAHRQTFVGKATVNRDRAAVFAFYHWAKRLKYSVPDFAPSRLRESPKQSKALSDEQLEAFYLHCRPDRWPFFWTLIETGARQGEVLNLTGGNVELDTQAISIVPQDGSKSHNRRSVPCSPELHNYLLTLATISGPGRLFPFARKTVQEWWAEGCKRAGIVGTTLHGLRATFITRALDDGRIPVQVQKLAGHSSLSMTMRYYRSTKDSTETAAQIRGALGIARIVGTERVPALSTAPPHPASPARSH